MPTIGFKYNHIRVLLNRSNKMNGKVSVLQSYRARHRYGGVYNRHVIAMRVMSDEDAVEFVVS
jgi:hypothetical protein